MRLKPPVSEDLAFSYLSQNAQMVWGEAVQEEISPILQRIANAMAIVSALAVPDEVEPLFIANDLVLEGQSYE